jgi:hypothetical protein
VRARVRISPLKTKRLSFLSISKFTVFFFWGEKADMATGEGVKRKLQ